MSNPNQPNRPEVDEPELISIIEGPPPQFQFVDDQSLLGFQNTQGPFEVARTDTRTFNGPKMIDRCRNAWAQKRAVMLEYRDMDGLKQRVEICGIRFDKLDEGTLLQIWVRMPVEMQLIELEDDDEQDEEADEFDDDESDSAGDD
jgi:hypothetical protein